MYYSIKELDRIYGISVLNYPIWWTEIYDEFFPLLV